MDTHTRTHARTHAHTHAHTHTHTHNAYQQSWFICQFTTGEIIVIKENAKFTLLQSLLVVYTNYVNLQ